jgi:hypothetical protein
MKLTLNFEDFFRCVWCLYYTIEMQNVLDYNKHDVKHGQTDTK